MFADPDRPGQWLDIGTPDPGKDIQPRFHEYWRKFLVPFNLVHHAGFYLQVPQAQTLLFDFHRGRRARPFDRLETARMHVAARYMYGWIATRWVPAAASLRISVRTVENHMRSIFGKPGVDSRTQLAAFLHKDVPATWQ